MDNESKIVYLEDLLLAQQEQIDEAITQRDEARTWARMLRNRALIAEQNSDSACAAYRKMYEQWAKSEREKLVLLEALRLVEETIENAQMLHPAHDEFFNDWMLGLDEKIRTALAKLE